MTRIAHAPSIPGETALHDGPIGAAPESWFMLTGHDAVRNVVVPTVTPVLPAPGTGFGSAALVFPGGGFLVGSLGNEGWPQARWLAARGIAAFVVKYRLLPTPTDPAAFGAAVTARLAAAAAANGDYRLDPPAMCVEDAVAALAWVRTRAAAHAIDPARIGILGYSAGAALGLALATDARDTARPAFLAAIYPPMTRRAVPPDAPPLFAALAADDPLFGRQGYGLVEGWRAAGRPVELHVYQGGGHGYGMGLPGTTSMGMMRALEDWLRIGGWIGDGNASGGERE